MAITFQQFDAEYRALTGHDGACRWQYRLYCEFAEGIFPTDIELGTGLGKTSVIALWVLAFGRVISKSPCAVPRRLVFVVDRRVVVDQASEFAEEIRLRLEAAEADPSHVLHVIAGNLRDAGCGHAVLETSTLRGQRTLDSRWRNDPSQPAVLVGTVDMIGSRLLFSGYGRLGPWAKPFEAGLIGQDCLLVLDEAHLCAPFASTLAAIERRTSQQAPLRVIRMGATMAPATDMLNRTPGLVGSAIGSSEDSVDVRKPFQLLPEETHEDKVRERLNAAKSGVLAEIATNAAEQLATWAVGILAEEPSAAIGIVVNTVAEARRCVKQLTDQLAKTKVPLGNLDFVSITGSMRGLDRDAMVKSDAYQRFRSQRDRSINHARPAFLIATSCIEVGADIDCDHLGTESCSADSLIQRLGRVNRLGKRKDSPSRVFVVGKPEDTPAGFVFAKLDRLSKAIQRLRARNRIENSEAELVFNSEELMTRLLGKCNSKKSLFQVHVPPPALTDAVLDDFALTSKYPDEGARPDVGRWLHGSIEEASLYVGLAWRLELDHVTLAQGAERLLDAFPISPRETARCPLYEAIDVIAAICKRNPENPGFIVVCRNGENVAHSLRSLPIDKDELRALLFDALIVLPSSVGGYDGRFVDPASSATVDDIAEANDVQPPTRALRRRLRVKSGRVFLATDDVVPLGEVDDGLLIDEEATDEELLRECSSAAKRLLGSGWRLIECAGNGMNAVLIAQAKRRGIEEADDEANNLRFGKPVPLEQHLKDARSTAERLCERLDVPRKFRRAVILAAANHDLGKNRPWWQRAVGNLDKAPVAKSAQTQFNHAINLGYRHELGSVVELQQSTEIASMEADERELCLHLIAAHHGHARPGFRTQAAGPLASDDMFAAIAGTPNRFARLQALHGWWTLAWLEAIVKAADGLASEDEARESL